MLSLWFEQNTLWQHLDSTRNDVIQILWPCNVSIINFMKCQTTIIAQTWQHGRSSTATCLQADIRSVCSS